jgi:hypothetical protein
MLMGFAKNWIYSNIEYLSLWASRRSRRRGSEILGSAIEIICTRFQVSGFRCQLVSGFWLLVAGNGLQRAWGIAHGVDNLKFNLDLKLLRFALCALLYAICLQTVTSDQKPVTRSLKPDTRLRGRSCFVAAKARNLKPKHGWLKVIIKNPCGVN